MQEKSNIKMDIKRIVLRKYDCSEDQIHLHEPVEAIVVYEEDDGAINDCGS